MTILVTGGTGFLGSHIVEQLSKSGRRVRALVRTSSDTRFLRLQSNVELSEGAVEDRESFTRAAEGVEAIIHVAGLVKARSEDEFMRTNFRGTENALDAARAARSTLRRFVLVSSQAVGGPSYDGAPVPVDAPSNPVTLYGKSKDRAEQAALAAKDEFPVTVIRPPLIYGPRDREVLAFFKAVNTGVLPYMGSPKKKISVVYGADAASACIAAIDAPVPSGSRYFIEDGTTRSFEDLVFALERALGKRAWLRVPLPRGVIEAAALGSETFGRITDRAVMLTRDKCNELFAPHWVCDGSDARRSLGWEPKVPFEEGAKRTATFYRENGWL
jgi:nucleoside-diphosphate-sugar epimerase